MSEVTEIVKIHPLVVSAACDHFTRNSLGGSVLPFNAPVVGLLFGTAVGGIFTVCDNTDVVLENVNGEDVMSPADIERRKRLWTTVYQQYSLIGWYAFGNIGLQPLHARFHASIQSYVADPIFLLFESNPVKGDVANLPIQAFRTNPVTSASAAASAGIKMLTPLEFKIDSSDVEKIAIDEIINAVPLGNGTAVENNNHNLITSITALEIKINAIISSLLKLKENGGEQVKPEILRQAFAICQALQRMNSQENTRLIQEEATNCSTALYMSTVTKSYAAVSELSVLYAMLYNNTDREKGIK